MKFTVQDIAGTDEAKEIQQKLKDYNNEHICPDQHKDLVISFKSDNGQVCGGLVGSTNWGWLFVRLLWVDEEARGKGMGIQLLKMAEEEAIKRDCKAAWIDTFNPVALKTYQTLGYQVFGKIEDFPPGKTRFFLKKKFNLK